jgi:hypothetical protein
MEEKRRFKIDNPVIVFTAFVLFVVSAVLIVVGVIKFSNVEEVEAPIEDNQPSATEETQNLNDFFEEDFQDYEVPENANLQYLKDDPFRGTCTGSEGDDKAPFSYGVVCLPTPEQKQ